MTKKLLQKQPNILSRQRNGIVYSGQVNRLTSTLYSIQLFTNDKTENRKTDIQATTDGSCGKILEES